MTRKPPPLPKKDRSAAQPTAPAPGSVFSALAGSDRLRTVAVDLIEASPFQARVDFDKDALAELAQSIEDKGLLSPPVVRPIGGGRYQLIAGERRTRAVKLLGRTEIEVLLEADCDDAAAAVLSLLENTARRDLNVIEEARAYAALIEDLGLTQEAVAKSVGKPRSTVANHLRLLTLPDEALALIADGKLSFAHGRALQLARDSSVQRQLAKQAADEEWSTRQLEAAARGANEQPNKPRAKPAADPQRASFAKNLAARVVAGSGLNCKVQVSGDGYAFQFTADTDDEAAVIADALARYRRANAET